MIRILIADDHAIVRHGLKQIIEKSGEMCVVAEADRGAEVLRKLREIECDVVLLDVSMPDMSGVDVLKQIHAERPHLPVLILSIYPEDQYAMRMIKAGAVGYMTKDSAPPEVVKALLHVAGGKKYISPVVAELLANELGAPEEKLPHQTLSDREYQIFLLLASAKTVSEIADTLSLSVKTISTYRTRILEKMRLDNNAELMRYAVDNHLAQ
ncbi:MAG: response regulator transcription factor [Nitrosomonadales bacterium]|nr:response regulator transcription factor [Nitrosomonadales bacterium]